MTIQIKQNDFGGAMAEIVKQSNIDWKRYPIVLSKGEAKTISMSLVTTVLKGDGRSPYEIAGIKEEDLQHVGLSIVTLQRAFKVSMETYAKTLDSACTKEPPSIDELKTEKRKTVAIGTAIGACFAGLGALPGYAIAKHLDNQHVRREACNFRKAWIHKVSVLEDQRLEEAKWHIYHAGGALVGRIQEMKDTGLFNRAKVRELRQLAQIREALFPNTPFDVKANGKDVHVTTFIQELPV